jgi:hypothetical protein
MRRSILILGGLGGLTLGFAIWWRKHRRFGTTWVNRLIDPWLVRHRIVDRSAGEIGLIEHVGRTSGIVRVSPVHPVPTSSGFRIIVPLGLESQWARNILAAGQCRLQVGEMVYELDEPRLVEPSQVVGLPFAAREVMTSLGFRYLLLHRFDDRPGRLEAVRQPVAIVDPVSSAR